MLVRMERRARLHLVPSLHAPTVSRGPEARDVGLLAFLLAVSLIPIGGVLAGGRWGDGSVGFATALALLCAREILHELQARRTTPRR